MSSARALNRPGSTAVGPGSASTAAPPPPAPLRYSVLYYKRTNKVHKNRGTTREDGILIINPPPSCSCSLVHADDAPESQEESEEEEEAAQGGGKMSKKKKYQAMRKKMNKGTHRAKSGVIWGGVHSELARRAHDPERGISVDDNLALSGQWECEVVSLLNNAANAGGGGKVGTMGGAFKGGLGQKRPPAKGLLAGRTAPRTALGALKKNAPGPLMSKKAGLGGMKKPGLGGMKRTLGSTAKLPSKLPAPNAAMAAGAGGGKMKKDKNGEWYLDKPQSESDDDGEKPATNALASMSRVPPSLLRSNSALAKRPRTVAGLGAMKSDTASTAGANDDDFFPGALGDKINVPASVRNVLRPHQREGVAFLWNCVTGASPGLQRAAARAAEASGSFDEMDDEEDIGGRKGAVAKGEAPRGAVLADEMGLGKTLMTIATIFAYYRRRRDRRFVVVCPSSLVSNWAKEFDKWLGKASQPKRVVVRNGAEKEGLRNLKSFVPLKPNQSEVLILSYELFRMHVKVIKNAKNIGLLVVDEGHRLKNTSGSQILTALNSVDAEARILITGTPIQNNLSEFYNVANFAVPGVLGDLPSFRRVYERPMSAASQKNASNAQKQKGRQQSKALDAITSTFVLRRLQKDVLKSLLPPRMELLLFCKPTDRQCELYRGIANRASKSIGSIGGVDDCNNPLMLLTEVRKLCTHPALLNEREAAEDASMSGKLVVLGNLLDSIRRHNPTDKVVIISNFTSALTVIEQSILRKKGLSFVRLDGSTDNKSRGALVDSFNNGSVDHSFAFLLSSKAGGCGLNLIGANRLVMVDADWNPATDQQAMARIYRQGQTKPCWVYRLFTTGTVDEVIYQRQIQKGNLAELANDGGKRKRGDGSASFSKEELRDCFTLKEGCTCDTKRKLGNKWSAYNGVSSLHSQGCMDEPLLSLCGSETLTFVRVMDEHEEPATAEGDAGDEESSSSDDMLSESDSERSFVDDEAEEDDEEEEESSEEEEFDG
ncbi:hypothetical protein ACHAXT_008839 [Thalassiosira profunda]